MRTDIADDKFSERLPLRGKLIALFAALQARGIRAVRNDGDLYRPGPLSRRCARASAR
jgi:hypothetical protein